MQTSPLDILNLYPLKNLIHSSFHAKPAKVIDFKNCLKIFAMYFHFHCMLNENGRNMYETN